jgi:hypothetical protein
MSILDGAPRWLRGTLSPEEGGGTWFACGARLPGTLDGAFDLREFPFDKQSVRIIIEDLVHESHEVVYKYPRNLAQVALPAGFAVDGWDVTSVEPREEPYTYDSLDSTYSRLSIGVNLRRVPTYFVSKYVFNVCMIIVIALTMSFFMAPTDPDRIAASFAAYCAVVSWLFVLVNQVPVLGYNTRLDNFLTAAFVTTFVLVLFNGARLLQERRAGDAAALAAELAAGKAAAAPAPHADGGTAGAAAEVAKDGSAPAPPAKIHAVLANFAVLGQLFSNNAVFDVAGHCVIALSFCVAASITLFAPL